MQFSLLKRFKDLGIKARFTIVITFFVTLIISSLIYVVVVVKIKETNEITQFYMESYYTDINHLLSKMEDGLTKKLHEYSGSTLSLSSVNQFIGEVMPGFAPEEWSDEDLELFESELASVLYDGLEDHDDMHLADLRRSLTLYVLEHYVENKRFYENGFVSIIGRDGNAIMYPSNKTQQDLHLRLFTGAQQIPEGNHRLYDENHQSVANIYFQYSELIDAYIVITLYTKEYLTPLVRSTLVNGIVSLFFAMIIFSIIFHYMLRSTIGALRVFDEKLNELAKGKPIKHFRFKREDEIGKIAHSLNRHIDGIEKTSNFADAIGRSEFDYEYTPLSDEDKLGNSLVKMRDNLRQAKEEEVLRKQEDEKRSWATEGFAKFGDILRFDNDKLDVLSRNIIKNLVKYLNVNQGGIFVLNDEDSQDKFLEMVACYAFDREKFINKQIKLGEGLTGTCFLEKQTIYLKKIPHGYIHISSGLGEANPSALLLVPLKINEEIYGVIELASFNTFEPHEISFVEKLAESIASTISSVKVNMRTAQLLEKSQQQAEDMKSQEEEMRQNMEELETTQEEMARKNEDQKRRDEAMQEELNQKNEEMRSQEEELRQTLAQMENNQKEIEQSKEEMSALVNNMPGIVYRCLIDADFTMDYISPYLEKITGYVPSQILSKQLTFAELIHPDDLDYVNSEIEKAIQTKTNFYVEYRLRDTNNEYHKVGEHGSLLKDKTGDVHHLQGLVFKL